MGGVGLLPQQRRLLRTAIIWLDGDVAIRDVRAEVLASERSRIVVAEGDLDHATGIALEHDLPAALLETPARKVGDLGRDATAVAWL